MWTGEEGQAVFVDTPGLHRAQSALGQHMSAETAGVVDDVDVLVFVVDASNTGKPSAQKAGSKAGRKPGHGGVQERPGSLAPSGDVPSILAPWRHDIQHIRRLCSGGKPVLLVLNKVDRIPDKSMLLPLLGAWQQIATFAAMVPLSAKKAQGVEGVVREILRLLPKAPPLYDADTLTDRTERFLVAELIREQLFLALNQEVPFGTAVQIEKWDERPEKGDVVVHAVVHVERDSQKGIVVGKRGMMLRRVGEAARQKRLSSWVAAPT